MGIACPVKGLDDSAVNPVFQESGRAAGFLLNLVVTLFVSARTYQPNPQIEAEFDEAVRLLDEDAYEATLLAD